MKNGLRTWAGVKARIKMILDEDCMLCNEDYWELENLFDELREAAVDAARDPQEAEEKEIGLENVLTFLDNASHLNGAQYEMLMDLAGEICGLAWEDVEAKAREIVGGVLRPQN